MAPRTRRFVLLSGWLLVQKPAGWTEPTGPPIEQWTQVKRFGSSSECESYRLQAAAPGSGTGSSAGSLRCVAEKPARPAPEPSGGW
jgi:hypothetical protein